MLYAERFAGGTKGTFRGPSGATKPGRSSGTPSSGSGGPKGRATGFKPPGYSFGLASSEFNRRKGKGLCLYCAERQLFEPRIHKCLSAQERHKPFSLRRLNSPGANPKLHPGGLDPVARPLGQPNPEDGVPLLRPGLVTPEGPRKRPYGATKATAATAARAEAAAAPTRAARATAARWAISVNADASTKGAATLEVACGIFQDLFLSSCSHQFIQRLPLSQVRLR